MDIFANCLFNIMSFGHIVILTNCCLDKLSSRQIVISANRHLDKLPSRQIAISTNCHLDKMSSWQIVISANCLLDKFSYWRIVILTNCHLDKLSGAHYYFYLQTSTVHIQTLLSYKKHLLRLSFFSFEQKRAEKPQKMINPGWVEANPKKH